MTADEKHDRCDFIKKCKCRLNPVTLLFAVDCSRLKLKLIPKLPNIIEKLSFKDNKIQAITDQAFSDMTNLLKLDLSSNEIYELRNSSFIGLTNLRSLNLQNNRLDTSMTSLNIKVLKPLENLTNLNIKHNLFRNFQPNLTLLVSLRSLGMDFISNDTGMISESFYSMKTLQELDLSGLTGNCSVRSLTNESFKHIPQIENLRLSGCRIKHINKGTFQQLKKISVLDISNNTCLKFEVLENVTHDLQFSAIKVLKLNKIHKVFDMNTMLRTSQIKYLANTSIQEIHGDSNRLQQIEIGAMLFMPNTLDYVSARDNQFSYGPFFWDLLHTSVKTFNVSHMFTFHTEDENPEQCSYDIVCKKEPITETKMKYGMEYRDHATPLPMAHQLTSLNYSSCHLHYSVSSYSLTNNILRNIDLMSSDESHHRCFFLNESCICRKDKVTLLFAVDCSRLRIKEIPKLPNIIEELSLKDNKIQVIPDQAFYNLTNLLKLDLSRNEIYELRNLSFIGLTNLRSLNLQDNRLDAKKTNILKDVVMILYVRKNPPQNQR
ncbi:toll-like receptor 4 [Mytilus trossulus]|uniref:toll-like receptor 4 n=1 Tax=Mytilus trossulus TaxID=6551 RepID=UPI003006E3B3